MDAALRTSGSYTDYSSVPEDFTLDEMRRFYPGARLPSGNGSNDAVRRRGPSQSFIFPTKLYDILSRPEFANVISWAPHGRCWLVQDRQAFIEHVMPRYFAQTKYQSFIRQVNGWGFKRITKGTYQGSYYNEFFLRTKKNLLRFMTRQPAVREGNMPEPNLSVYFLLPPNLPPKAEKQETAARPSVQHATVYSHSQDNCPMIHTSRPPYEGNNNSQRVLATKSYANVATSAQAPWSSGSVDQERKDTFNHEEQQQILWKINRYPKQRNQSFASLHPIHTDYFQNSFPPHGQFQCKHNDSRISSLHCPSPNAAQACHAAQMGPRGNDLHNYQEGTEEYGITDKRISLHHSAQDRGPQFQDNVFEDARQAHEHVSWLTPSMPARALDKSNQLGGEQDMKKRHLWQPAHESAYASDWNNRIGNKQQENVQLSFPPAISSPVESDNYSPVNVVDEAQESEHTHNIQSDFEYLSTFLCDE
uniref:HSF-type DNA-binding domain-containing protein n=1 Tax=Odontella aurita TaxID=265563 RepID=A0A7S4J5H0_9STRA|mmetsp:Transcript_39052/g.117365  ORF Transcript_39052/g.117365 Transcript_39052/m.117365 type:complete len:475 (+) Transcript_39052:98-1522(+)